MGYKQQIIGSLYHTKQEDLFLDNLKNYLNDNLHYTNFPKTTSIIRIKSLFELTPKGKKYYGCMADLKDSDMKYNKNGIYGKEYAIPDEYPGSFDFDKEGMEVFLRNDKIHKIKERLNDS